MACAVHHTMCMRVDTPEPIFSAEFRYIAATPRTNLSWIRGAHNTHMLLTHIISTIYIRFDHIPIVCVAADMPCACA